MAAATGKKRAEVIVLLDSDDNGELAESRQRTRQRREARRGRSGTSSASAAADDGGDSLSAAAATGSSAAAASRTHSWRTEWARPPAEITCPICFCMEAPDNACVLASYGHGFCVECITTFVNGKIAQGEVLSDQLACPCVEPKRCAVPLVPQDVRRCFATAAEGDRYERLALQRCVEAEEDMGTCPSAGCSFMFAWEEDNRKLDCPLCKKSFCLVCRTKPWHAGVRCEAFQQQRAAESGDADAADAAFAQFASNQRLRACPKCKFWVEKTSGCDAMHCRCNLVFCYVCGGVLKGGVAANKQAGGAFKVCSCGGQRDAELRAHEDPRAVNHNLQGGLQRAPPPPPRHMAAMRRALEAMGAPAWMAGGLGSFDGEDDEDSDGW